MLSPKDLEKLADNLLSDELKSKNRWKSKQSEYSILSETQLRFRYKMEIPYSNLSKKQKLECRSKNLEYEADAEGEL